jgi:hypothetical protein
VLRPVETEATPLTAELMLDENPLTVVDRDVTPLFAVDTPADSEVI